jgi:hypothetical protein
MQVEAANALMHGDPLLMAECSIDVLKRLVLVRIVPVQRFHQIAIDTRQILQNIPIDAL